MKYTSRHIVFQEIPNEISLSYLISGCKLKCEGCHSKDSWPASAGTVLTLEKLQKDLTQYQNFISCVLFMGGEWHERELIEYLQAVRRFSKKTALYTGELQISRELEMHLDYLKVGPYIKEKGGLNSPITNQKLIDIKSGRNLNRYFHQEGESHDLT